MGSSSPRPGRPTGVRESDEQRGGPDENDNDRGSGGEYRGFRTGGFPRIVLEDLLDDLLFQARGRLFGGQILRVFVEQFGDGPKVGLFGAAFRAVLEVAPEFGLLFGFELSEEVRAE